MTFTPRPSQQNILRYNGGRLGIAAVPGAGKTHILSALAAQIIQSGALGDDQEVLIVTLVNSAVDNFEARIKRSSTTRCRRCSNIVCAHCMGWRMTSSARSLRVWGLRSVSASSTSVRRASSARSRSMRGWRRILLDDYLDPALDQSKRDWVKREQLPNYWTPSP